MKKSPAKLIRMVKLKMEVLYNQPAFISYFFLLSNNLPELNDRERSEYKLQIPLLTL
jgi:hypothetical protein